VQTVTPSSAVPFTFNDLQRAGKNTLWPFRFKMMPRATAAFLRHRLYRPQLAQTTFDGRVNYMLLEDLLAVSFH
jgi:hypothetical protein